MDDEDYMLRHGFMYVKIVFLSHFRTQVYFDLKEIHIREHVCL